MTSFSFKSAALGQESRYELFGDRIVQHRGENAAKREILFSEITGLRYATRNVRMIQFSYFDILTEDQRDRLRIAANVPRASWNAEPDSQAFCDLVEQIVERLAVARPDLEVRLGDSQGWQIAWFNMGLAMTLFGFGFPAFAYFEGVDFDRLIVAAPVMVLMGLFGSYLAWTSRPWRPPVTLDLPVFLKATPSLLRFNRENERD